MPTKKLSPKTVQRRVSQLEAEIAAVLARCSHKGTVIEMVVPSDRWYECSACAANWDKRPKGTKHADD